MAELKKRIQDKEKQKNNQSLPRKNHRLPKPKNTDERQKIIPKQVKQKSTSSLKKTQKKNGPKISVKKKNLKNNNSKQKTGIKDIKQRSPKSPVSPIQKTHKKPKFNIPKEGFQ